MMLYFYKIVSPKEWQGLCKSINIVYYQRKGKTEKKSRDEEKSHLTTKFNKICPQSLIKIRKWTILFY